MVKYLNQRCLNQMMFCHYVISTLEVPGKNEFVKSENYLNMLNGDFTVKGLSETWLNDNNNDLYGLRAKS